MRGREIHEVDVKECIDAGLTSLAGLNNDLEFLYDEDILDPTPPPPSSHSLMLTGRIDYKRKKTTSSYYFGYYSNSFLQELGYYLNHCQSLPSLQSLAQLKPTSPITCLYRAVFPSTCRGTQETERTRQLVATSLVFHFVVRCALLVSL